MYDVGFEANGADKGYSHGTGVLIFAFARAVLGTNKKNFNGKTRLITAV